MLQLVKNLGKKWSEISKQLPGRNENSVKNRFFSLLRKEKKKQQISLFQNNDNLSVDDCQDDSKELMYINNILQDINQKKNDNDPRNEISVNEIKLKNLMSSMDNIKITTISRLNKADERVETRNDKKKQEQTMMNLKTEIIEETKTPSPPMFPHKIQINSNNNLNLPLSSNNIPQNPHSNMNNMGSYNNMPNPNNNNNNNNNFQNNPFENKSNPFLPNFFFQNIPKFIQMNTFGLINPYAFPPPMSPYDSFKYTNNQYMHKYHNEPSQQEFEKVESVLNNHPLYQTYGINNSNQTPQTLKNNETLKRDFPSFSAHPLVQNPNEIVELTNSNESSLNLDPKINQSASNTAQFQQNLPNTNTMQYLEQMPLPQEMTLNLKIKNGLDLNPSDYSQCHYSVVNFNKKELYLFTPLSNASESNRSFFSAAFNNLPGMPSSMGSNNNPEDFNSLNSLTKMNSSFRQIKKHRTFNSLFPGSQQSSNNCSKDQNNTLISNSPPHSPKKDSKFKENHVLFNFQNE